MRDLPLQTLGRDEARTADIEADIVVTRAALIEARRDARHARGVLIQGMQDALRIGGPDNWRVKRYVEKWLGIEAHADLKVEALREGLAALEARLEEMKTVADVPRPARPSGRGRLAKFFDWILSVVWHRRTRTPLSSE